MKGADVSTFQGDIDWEAYSSGNDFVIIRAGFGKNNVDVKALENLSHARKYNVPVGVYWFSYALNEEDAANEFDYCYAICRDTELPIYMDYEAASMGYADRCGVRVNPTKLADAFLGRAKQRGLRAGLYCNLSYYRSFFRRLDIPSLWLAQWEIERPSVECDIWQYTNEHNAAGITGKCDYNILYNEALIDKEPAEVTFNVEQAALEVLRGKYGNGAERKEKLGAHYDEVQDRVNEYYTVAKSVIRGDFGNGATRKQLLRKHGFDPAAVQNIVNSIL